jgi:hypothetical protein
LAGRAADRNFFNWADWCLADDTGAALLWRVKADLRLPVLAALPDHSYLSVVIDPTIRGKARARLLDAATRRRPLDRDQARYVRVVEYDVPDRDGNGGHELFALVTNILDPREGSARRDLRAALGTRDRQRPGQDPPARAGSCARRARSSSSRRCGATC